MTVATWFWIVFGLWVVLMLFHAYRGLEDSRQMESYNVPRGRSPWALGLSTAATQASPATFLGVAGFAFAGGLAGLWWALLVPLAFTTGLAVCAQIFRRTGRHYGVLTLPEWMSRRFDSNVLGILVALLFLFNIFYIVAQFSGIGQIMEETGGITYTTGIIAAAVLITIYTLVGGNHAVVKTDAWQAAFMGLAALIVAGGVLLFLANPAEITRALAERGDEFTTVFNPEFPVFAGVGAVLSFALFQGMFGTLPYIANRYLMLDRAADFRKYLLTAGAVVFLLSLSTFAGLGAAALVPDAVDAPDQSPLVLVNTYFPAVFAALFSLGIVAAAISTADSVLVSMGAAVGNDIYRQTRLGRGAAAEERTATVNRVSLVITRLAVVLTASGALWLAWRPPEFLAVVAALGTLGFFAGVSGPLLLGLYWRGATKFGAMLTCIVGPGVFYVLHFVLEFHGSVFVNGALGILFGFVAMFLVSLVTPKPSATALEFFDLPADTAETARRPPQ